MADISELSDSLVCPSIMLSGQSDVEDEHGWGENTEMQLSMILWRLFFADWHKNVLQLLDLLFVNEVFCICLSVCVGRG